MADILYLEPVGGIAGDMFLAACLDAGLPLAELEGALRCLPISGWRFEAKKVEISGIVGTHLDVLVEKPAPSPGGAHGAGPHRHDHDEHHGRHLSEILELIDQASLSPRAREAAKALFSAVGAAEAKIHGIPAEQLHFHEVGAVDSIVDLCGAAVALDLLGWPKLVSAVPALGRGLARMAHGTMPVPPPAVLELLRGKPVELSGPEGEAVTPTGAAILAVLAEIGPPPALLPERIGYGVGTARWADRPNVLRATLGTRVAVASRLVVLEANVDDSTGQMLARAIEAALEAGAKDAWAAPVTMKKGRPGHLLGALAAADRQDAVARALFAETSTIGVRIHEVSRLEAERELVEVATPFGPVRVKVARFGGRETNAQPEWDDCVARAKEKGVPVKDVLAAAAAAYDGLRRRA
jgi:uncharacterized protein (TIGR00299 family) protein